MKAACQTRDGKDELKIEFKTLVIIRPRALQITTRNYCTFTFINIDRHGATIIFRSWPTVQTATFINYTLRLKRHISLSTVPNLG